MKNLLIAVALLAMSGTANSAKTILSYSTDPNMMRILCVDAYGDGKNSRAGFCLGFLTSVAESRHNGRDFCIPLATNRTELRAAYRVWLSDRSLLSSDQSGFDSAIAAYREAFPCEESSATTIQKSSKRKRSADEIEHVFQKNKGGIFNEYNRALRRNPSLAGQFIFELTISPDGEVTAANVLSSELGDEALERKLILKIKRFKFSKEDVEEITVTYPIDFLPS